jgi:hypothetical protein
VLFVPLIHIKVQLVQLRAFHVHNVGQPIILELFRTLIAPSVQQELSIRTLPATTVLLESFPLLFRALTVPCVQEEHIQTNILQPPARFVHLEVGVGRRANLASKIAKIVRPGDSQIRQHFLLMIYAVPVLWENSTS